MRARRALAVQVPLVTPVLEVNPGVREQEQQEPRDLVRLLRTGHGSVYADARGQKPVLLVKVDHGRRVRQRLGVRDLRETADDGSREVVDFGRGRFSFGFICLVVDHQCRPSFYVSGSVRWSTAFASAAPFA